MNIESLQLPPNPVGPYMRQNREQLLAKQQILEQFARQQKQMQLSQQRQQSSSSQHQQMAFPSSHHQSIGGMPLLSSGKRTGQSDRPFSSSNGPPGFNNNTRYNDHQNSHDRSSFYQQRPKNQHSPRPLPTQGYPSFNPSGGFSGSNFHQQQQARSISDIRMDNNMSGAFPPREFMNDHLPPFRDQYNQMQDVFSSSNSSRF